MDYTKLPKQLIYRERRSLEEFTDNNKLNDDLVNSMLDIPDLQSANFKDRALACFNAAYYICTLIKSDAHPEWCFPLYCDIAFCKKKDDVVSQAVTLSLVSIYIEYSFGEEWRQQHKKLTDKLDEFIKGHIIEEYPFGDYSYEDVCKQLNSGPLPLLDFPDDEFALRTIDHETIRDLQISQFDWTLFTNYYKDDILREIVFKLGKSEEEMNQLVASFRHDADIFYTHDNPYYEELCERLWTIENDIYNSYHYEEDQNQAIYEDGQQSEQVDIAPLKARIAELEAENERINNLKAMTPEDAHDMMKEILGTSQPVKSPTEEPDSQEARIRELEEEISRLENDLEAFKTPRNKNRMSASQAAMFLLTVCYNLGGLPNDKKKLSPILESGWNLSESTATRALGSKLTQAVADKTAKYFECVSPHLARLIREFPDTFDELRKEKLKINNDNRVKKD